MIRFLIEIILPFLLPSLLYLGWWWLAGRRRAVADGGVPSFLQHGPWFWLILAGAVLLAAVLSYNALTDQGPTTGRYVPPHLQDGRVVPGHVE
jgi:hypothetical protein